MFACMPWGAQASCCCDISSSKEAHLFSSLDILSELKMQLVVLLRQKKVRAASVMAGLLTSAYAPLVGAASRYSASSVTVCDVLHALECMC